MMPGGRIAIMAGTDGEHFAQSKTILTRGVHVGGGDGAAERVVADWSRIGEIVPGYGFMHTKRELAGGPGAASKKAAAG